MTQPIGFIGLGVMGEPICRHLAEKSGQPVFATDLSPEPISRLRASGVCDGKSTSGIVEVASVIFLSLPSGRHVEALCRAPSGLLETIRQGQTIVDLGTSPVGLSRQLATEFERRGSTYADAPVARTRQAAERGELSVMVGSDAPTFDMLQPLLSCFATDITHCGDIGAGQFVKIANNMVLFETVVALSEAMELARREGIDPTVLFDALSRGSADSFALRNHGMKAMLPGEFAERAFSVVYALKDVTYALDMARSTGIQLAGADVARRALERAIELGDGDRYWPVISRAIAESIG